MKAFEKIIGYDSVKTELYQIIDMFKNKELYEKMGAKLPKGVLIVGEPGMGKSMLAEALIEECNVKSYSIKMNKETKELINEITDTFLKASENESAIILFDDIDKFSEASGEKIDDKVFVTIQSGIDSVKNNNVLVVATANNYLKLPDSLIRNGRFDKKIELVTPSYDDARKIIEYYMKNKPVDPNLNYEDVSKMISYTSCADLQSILNRSAIYASYQRKQYIEMEYIVKSYLSDRYSSPDENYKCSDERIEETSLHEAGHAAVAEVLQKGSIGFVCVKTSGRNEVDGFTSINDELNRRPYRVLVALGGKAAVELFNNGKCASGCYSDLRNASSLLKSGIKNNGICGFGMLDNGHNQASDSYQERNEAVIAAELERYMFIAKEILLKNKDFLMALTKTLKDKHILLYSDIQKIRSTFEINCVSGI